MLDGVSSAPRFPAAHKSSCQQAQSEQSDKRQIGCSLGEVTLIGRVAATVGRGSAGTRLIIAAGTRGAGAVRSSAARGGLSGGICISAARALRAGA